MTPAMALVERRKPLMQALRALHLRLMANSGTPFVIACGRVAVLARFAVLPSLGIDRTPRSKQIETITPAGGDAGAERTEFQRGVPPQPRSG
jgi:hypothetical protein